MSARIEATRDILIATATLLAAILLAVYWSHPDESLLPCGLDMTGIWVEDSGFIWERQFAGRHEGRPDAGQIRSALKNVAGKESIQYYADGSGVFMSDMGSSDFMWSLVEGDGKYCQLQVDFDDGSTSRQMVFPGGSAYCYLLDFEHEDYDFMCMQRK